MAAFIHQAHGLVVQSDLPLWLPPAAPCARPDVLLRRDTDRAVPSGHPPGELLAVLHDRLNRITYAIARDSSSTRIRYPGLCEFEGDAEMRSVVVRKEPGVDEGVVSVVAAGALLAVHLMLCGELVLHASAVHVGGAAIAFVGASGMGKSTLAALLSADGCELVSDDVLRVARSDAGPASAYAGSVECRLRPNASTLTDAWRAPVRRTGDDRTAVALDAYVGPPLPLAACVVPLPDREATELTVTTLSRADGLKRLLRYPRIVGWVEHTWPVRNLRALAGLVARVPVLEARIPWGPPFALGLAGELTSAVLRAASADPIDLRNLPSGATGVVEDRKRPAAGIDAFRPKRDERRPLEKSA